MKILALRNIKNSNAGAANSRKQKGFTIIELVVVILLLGILTATALPRFMDVSDEAHVAVVDATTAGLSTGMAMFRAQWVAQGQPTAAIEEFDNLLAHEDSGYPVGLTDNTDPADETDCAAVFVGMLQEAGSIGVTAVANGTPPATPDGTGAAGSYSDDDFIATFVDAADPGCAYYYVAASQGATDVDVPYLYYTPADGTLARNTATAAVAN